MAESSKLSVLETHIEHLIRETQDLPQQLVQYGRTRLSRSAISKLIGRLYIQRNDMNLHSDLLDVPGTCRVSNTEILMHPI